MARPEPKRWGTAALGGLLVALGGALFGAARGAAKTAAKTATKAAVKTAAKPNRRGGGAPDRRGAAEASGRPGAPPKPKVGRAKVRTKPKPVAAPARTRYWPPPAPKPIEPDEDVNAAEAAAQADRLPVDRESETLGYEVQDTKVGTIARIIALSVSVIVISVGSLFWFIGHAHRDDGQGPPLTRQQSAVIVPPEPHLQDHPLHDIAVERQRESGLLASYAWTGPDHRTARIPIARAQALVIGRPLDPPPAAAVAVPAANP